MIAIVDVLTPLYLLIALGFWLRLRRFPSGDFWAGVEQLTYFVLFPALIFHSLAQAQIDLSFIGLIVPTIVVPALLVGALQWLAFFDKRLRPPTFTSMFQGAVRNNTSMALVLAALVLPAEGLALMVLTATIMILFNNISCVAVLMRYGEGAQAQSFTQLWLPLVTNPLIVASALGLAVNFSGLLPPQALLGAFGFLGQSGLPLLLLAVGAGLRFRALGSKLVALLLPSAAKLLIFPLLTYSACHLLQVDPDTSRILLLYAAIPTAMSSYLLAGQLGGDSETMAQIISLQIIIAAFTLPLVLTFIASI